MADVKKDGALYGALIVLECVFWGIGNPVVKIAMTSITPFWCLALRFSLASLLCFAVFGPQVFSQLRGKNLLHCLVISFFNAVAYIFSNLSLSTTSATTAGFLMSLSVIFTPFLAYFFVSRRFDRRMIPIVAIVVMGLFFLCGGNGDFSIGSGESFALLSSLALAATITYSTLHVAGIGPKALSTAQTLMAAAVALPFALLFEDTPRFADIPMQSWAAISYLALFCTLIAYMLQNIALKHVSPVFASLAFSSEPIFTAIAAYFLLGELLNTMGYIGGGLIIAGIACASVLQSK